MSRTIKKKMKRIYIIESERSAIKIGISQDVEKRIRTLSKQGGFKVKNLYYTEYCSNAYSIEHDIHLMYKDKCIDSEWFDVPFKDAVSALKNMFYERACFIQKTETIIAQEDIDAAFQKE